MNTETLYDFSMDSVPDAWRSAADDAPEVDQSPLKRKRSMLVMPSGEKLDLTTALISALALSVASGTTWYLFETRYLSNSPWLAVLVALIVTLAVRLGGTSADRELRATMSSVFFMATVMTTVYFIERTEFRAAYGENPDLAESELAFVRDRLSEPEVVLSWVAGLVLCMQVSYLTAKRRRRVTV